MIVFPSIHHLSVSVFGCDTRVKWIVDKMQLSQSVNCVNIYNRLIKMVAQVVSELKEIHEVC